MTPTPMGSYGLGAPSRSGPGVLGLAPGASRLTSFKGPQDTLASMERLAHGERGQQSVLVRSFTESVTRDIHPKDYLGEILAIRNCFLQPSPTHSYRALFRYTNDPLNLEWIKDPQRQVEEIRDSGSTLVDCEEIALIGAVMGMQVGREVQFIALGYSPQELTHVGTRIKEPKSGTWIWVDPVAGPRERDSAEQAKEILVWSID